MLKLKFTDNRQPPFWVLDKTFTLGRDEENNLAIDDETVSAHHAKIINKSGKYFIKDGGSDIGTFVNDQRITQKMIAIGDALRIGGVELEIVDPLFENAQRKSAYWALIGDSSWLSGQEFPLKLTTSNSLTIGRGTQCDLVFPGTHLSRSHAEITLNSKGSLTIRDLNSANGTYLNDNKIKEAELHPGDQLRFDVYSFKVFGPGIKMAHSASNAALANMDTQPNKAISEKHWQSKPTSPGNREELNLYKKNLGPIVISTFILGAIIGIAGYIGVKILAG